MGRYMESTTPLPEGADSQGRTMTMLSDNRLAYFDAAAGLLLSEDEGKAGALRKHTVILFPRMFVNNSSIAPDGSLILCHVQSLENQELVYNIIGMDTAGTKGKFWDSWRMVITLIRCLPNRKRSVSARQYPEKSVPLIGKREGKSVVYAV